MERFKEEAVLSLITSSTSTVEIKCICLKEKLRFTQCGLILLSFLFSQNKRQQPQSGESAYADHGAKFLMNMFHLKADKKEEGESVY